MFASGATFPDDYSVALSADGEKWTTVATVTGDSEIKNAGRILSFEAMKARYVKITVTKLSAEMDGADRVCTMSEIKVFGIPEDNSVVNLAQGIPAAPSSSWEDHEGFWRSVYLTDGSYLSMWPLPRLQDVSLLSELHLLQ